MIATVWLGRSLRACVLMLGLLTAGHAAADYWGSFKRDHCTKRGFRQYSSQLMDIPWGQDWTVACNRKPADIFGYTFSKPARCPPPNNGQWGEFDVPDGSCPHWGELKDDGCEGAKPSQMVRRYSAVLWDIPPGQDWLGFCYETPREFAALGQLTPQCEVAGGHVWGIWRLGDPNKTCPPPPKPPIPIDSTEVLLDGTQDCGASLPAGTCYFDVCSATGATGDWPVWVFRGVRPKTPVSGTSVSLLMTVKELRERGGLWVDSCDHWSMQRRASPASLQLK
jgi:hypothetical protein